MAKARTTAATTVEEPIVEQNVETTAVVEEPQTVAEEPQTVSEEPTENTIVEGDTTSEDTPQESDTTENTEQTVSEEGNNEILTKFIKMSGINMPYAKEVMALPNFEYYLPIGSGINMEERSNLISQIKEYNKPSEDNQ